MMANGMPARRILRITMTGLFLLGALLLICHPFFRSGMLFLFNRLFSASEARNLYEYERFSGADVQAAPAALVLFIGSLLSFFLVVFLVNRHIAALLVFASAVFVQAYFGVPFPTVANVGLLLLCALFLVRQMNLWQALYILAVVGLIVLSVWFFIPGEHAQVEKWSEQVRDWLGRTNAQQALELEEPFSEWMETQHTNEKSIDSGEKEARGTEGLRLVQIEKMQISRPDWINLLRTAGIFLGMLILLLLPFAPFVLLNMRRNQVRTARAAFDSLDDSKAISAMFRHAIRYLAVVGQSERNVPYSAWTLPAMPDSYREIYHECAQIWEKTVYSDHLPAAGERERMKTFLAETERLLFEEASRGQRFRLSVVECLHE